MADLDEDYLTAWSYERQVAAYNRDRAGSGVGTCPRCWPHAFHGLSCTVVTGVLCHCPSAWAVAS